ncbi:indole-3-glycerol phosphate synthase TrpC [Fortiea contorta]|uniref:indole-3-glycerol phosphate synthase TrpC n=1 Tax=Fortiea contorta TaxID=1892405 RepID=UPI000348A5EC|nr:indole-3-glycerol phosphate synthase TrpC [Fortiea contorta]
MIYPVTNPNTRLEPTIKEIIWHKKQEVTQLHQEMSLASLQRQLSSSPTVRDFFTALQQSVYRPSLIAEIKKVSPIHGIIRADFDPIAIARAYERGGATCISVITEATSFHGSFDHLRAIRHRVPLPLLCKEFIIDPCQIYLARASGADAILLMAALLSDRELQDFVRVIHYLGMNAVVEVHSIAELDRALKLDDLRIVAINNQNLADLTIDIDTTRQLLAARRTQLQNLGAIVISESGLYTPNDLSLMAEVGTDAVLIGDCLLKQQNIEMAVRRLLRRDNPHLGDFGKRI